MAIDFPASPTNGQTYLQYIYDSSIPGWRNQNSSEGIGLQFKSGLVPITPTSVTVSSGSATISSNGEIYVSSASDITLNGIFTSTYRNYRIVYVQDGTNTGDHVYCRFSTNGTPNSSSTYEYASFYIQANGYGTWPYSGANNWMICGFSRDFIYDIFNPQKTLRTTMQFQNSYSQTRGSGQAGFTGTTSFDGMSFSGNYYTGAFKIYGYN